MFAKFSSFEEISSVPVSFEPKGPLVDGTKPFFVLRLIKANHLPSNCYIILC